MLIEDSETDAELILFHLEESGFAPACRRVQTEAEFVRALTPGTELVLADCHLPDFSGLRALRLIRERDLDMPFIIVSGTIGEEVAVELMREGAFDYLLKDRLHRLGPAIRQALELSRLRREQRKSDQRIRDQLAELLRWQEVMLGREERIHSLKREVNELLARVHQPPRYRAEHAP